VLAPELLLHACGRLLWAVVKLGHARNHAPAVVVAAHPAAPELEAIKRKSALLQIPADVLPGPTQPMRTAVVEEHVDDVRDGYAALLGQAGRAGIGVRPKRRRDASWQPRCAISTASDHDPIGPRKPQRLSGVLDGPNIAVDDNRDGNRFLHAPDERPVGTPLEELATCAAM